MDIEGVTALITGANRGLGKVFAEALLEAGAAKVYAGARDPSTVTHPDLHPVRLDVTSPAEVAAAAAACSDVTLLINNAGYMAPSSMLADGSDAVMRREMEINVFGVLAMTRAFAPILAANGGGAIVNVLSVASWFTPGYNATYAASKHAALSVTEGSRIELKAQGTRVVAVHAGFIDTDMVAGMDVVKVPPQQVVAATLQGLRDGLDTVLADDRARHIWQSERTDPAIMQRSAQETWDARPQS